MVNLIKKYYKSQAENMHEIRSIRHDIQAHMIVLQYYLEKEKYGEAKEYLQAMRVSKNFNNDPIVDMGNDLINAIAFDTIGQSEEDIKLFCEGYIPEKLDMSDFDLCTLFSNLFSNAVEACEKLRFSKRKITMKLSQDGNDFLISISNPTEWDIDKKILGTGTTKHDAHLHGYGIRNICRTVEKYQGKTKFRVRKGLFGVDIRLPNVICE